MFSATEITKVTKRFGFCLPRLALFAFFAAFAENPENPVIQENPGIPVIIIDRSSEIVLPAGAPSATRLAVEELNFFLKGVLGAPLPVVTQRTAGKTAIVLGGGPLGERALPDGGRGATALPAGPDDAYVIKACSNVVRIVGNDDDPPDPAATAALPDEAPWQPCFRRGTLFGVYAFLERFAGVRMYFPGELGTCIPKVARIAVPEGRIEEAPAFSVRRFGYADGPVARDLLAGLDETAFKRLNWYRLRMETYHLRCCHGAKTHCLSPETWDSIYTNACAVIGGPLGERALPGGAPGGRALPAWPPVFDAMPEDGFTWARHCKCDWCANNIPFSKTDTGFATDLVWRRTAELANRLAARFHHARVSQMSYIPYVRIPTNDIPGNVDVFVARRGPWAEGTAIGARERDEVCRWHEKLGRKVSLWNYPDKVDCWNLEMKDIPQLAPRAWAAYYRAVAPHVTGAFAESESDRWLYNYLNYYVFSRVCWNPETDVEAILAEHHRLMFGAAAEEMAEFFDTLESCWMKVVAHPYDTPLGPGVCKAPTEKELRERIYSTDVLMRLTSLISFAEAKVAAGSLEARRITLFQREYLEPLAFAVKETNDCSQMANATIVHKSQMANIDIYGNGDNCEQFRFVNIGLISDVHVGDDNDASDLKRALRLFDVKKADAVIAAGDLTDLGLLSELKQVATAWNEVFPGNRRSDGEPVVRLFHYGDHDTALNFKVRQREVVAKGRWADYIPHIGPDVAWRLAFGEPFETVVRRIVKGCEFTAVHFLPDGGAFGGRGATALPGELAGSDHRAARKPWLHVFSQHRAYRGLFARPGCGDEISWDDGVSLAFLTNTPNTIAVCGHAHISATNDTSFVAGNFSAIAIPSLFYQIETWLPRPKGDHDSHQALFMVAAPDGIIVERLDVCTGGKIAPDVHLVGTAPRAVRPEKHFEQPEDLP